MAGRRQQKGPSTEELLNKLEQRFNAFQEDHNKELSDMKTGYEVSIEQLKEEYDQKIQKIKEESKEIQSEYVKVVSNLKEEQNNQWDKGRLQLILGSLSQVH